MATISHEALDLKQNIVPLNLCDNSLNNPLMYVPVMCVHEF